MSTENNAALTRLPAEMPDWAKAAIEKYTAPGAYNLLLPAIPLNGTLGFGQQVKVSKVAINPDMTAGEVYKVGAVKRGDQWVNQLALAKPALQRIASAAGIQFKTRRVDDRRDRMVVEYECIAAVKNESGAVVMQGYTKSIDLRDVQDEELQRRIKANEKLKPHERKPEDQIHADVEEYIVTFRRHMAARCESGAILRAIRGQLGIKQQWTQAELAKPFVLLRVDFQPDAEDPVVKRFLLEQGQRAASMIFPGGATAAAPTAVVVDDSPETPAFTSDQPDASTVVETVATKPVDLDAEVAQAARVMEVGPRDLMNLYRKHGGDPKLVLAELNEMATKSPDGSES